MNNPNSAPRRYAASLRERWSGPDLPGMEPRFQILSFLKDLFVFVALPGLAVLFAKSEGNTSANSRPLLKSSGSTSGHPAEPQSQIVSFDRPYKHETPGVHGSKGPGTLVRVRLENELEALSGAPVHAQIIDAGLGSLFEGGELIGDGSADQNYNRINVTFTYARKPGDSRAAFPIAARAVSLNGILGVEADHKEGLVMRGLSAGVADGTLSSTGGGEADLKGLLIQALTSGLSQELGRDASVEHSRSEVLELKPGAEFFAELTDFFPKEGK